MDASWGMWTWEGQKNLTKNESYQLVLICRLLLTKWFAAYSQRARDLLVCHQMQITSLHWLTRWTPQFKFKKMYCKTEASSHSYRGQWQASYWLQCRLGRVPVFWKQGSAVLEFFGAHAALKGCSFTAFQIFFPFAWFHGNTSAPGPEYWNEFFTSKPEDLYKCIL